MIWRSPNAKTQMPTPRETILATLHARLSALPATVLRGDVLPERVPAEGLLILRDGEPGEPEVTLSPLAYHYQHRARSRRSCRAPIVTAPDALCAGIGTALAAEDAGRALRLGRGRGAVGPWTCPSRARPP